eukprot:scaffold36519_cov28-Attheya_sp.AAC.1
MQCESQPKQHNLPFLVRSTRQGGCVVNVNDEGTRRTHSWAHHRIVIAVDLRSSRSLLCHTFLAVSNR